MVVTSFSLPFQRVTVTTSIMQRSDVGVNANPAAPPARPAPDGRRDRWEDHRTQRRAELVAAAVTAVTRYGSDVDMEQVAAVAGVSKPVLYRYFADKAQLWTAVGEEVARVVIEAVTPRLATVDAKRELV